MKFAYSLLLLVFSVIILCEVTGIYFLYEFKKNMEDQIVKDSEKVDIMMVHRIDSYTIERLIDLTNLAKSSTFETALQASNKEFSNMTDPELYMNNANSVWTSTPKGETTPFMKSLIDSRPSEQLRQIQYFESLMFGGKMYGDVFMTNSYGANVIELDKTSDYKHNDEQWWKAAKNQGSYIGAIDFDKNSGTSSYVIAIQLNDEQGNFIGVAKAVVSTQQMIKIIKSQMNSTDPSPIQYELISNDKVIYSTDPTEKPGSLNNELNYSNNLKDPSGHFIRAVDDENYLVTYSHSVNSKFSPLFNWVFVAKYESSEIMTPVYELSNFIVIMILVLLVIVSTTVFVMSRKLARPIEQIRQGLISFNKGDMVTIKPHGEEEVQNLIAQFNHMVETHSNSQNVISKSEEKSE